MRKFFLFVFILFAVFSFSNFVFAEGFLSVGVGVDVPRTCDVVDTDGISHTYESTNNESYLGICALDVLLEKGDISSVGLSNQYPEMGLFVTSFNNVSGDPSSQYWALYLNDSYAEKGITTLKINKNDILSFKLSDFRGIETGDKVIIKINSLLIDEVVNEEEIIEEVIEEIQNNEEEKHQRVSYGSYVSTVKISPLEFDIEKAFEFLISKQSSDGSYGNSMYTDWSAIALSLKEVEAKEKIREYLVNNKMESSIITDYERRAMALMSLGINPYDDTDFDYIKKIIDSFDGKQIGDSSLINDDIFGILVLKNAGFNENDEIIKKTILNILKNYENKAFESLDIASALVQSLGGFEEVEGVSNLKQKAKEYILFYSSLINNPFTASWIMQSGIEKEKSKEYLINNQNKDGGLNSSLDKIDYRVWATSYAIPAILGKTWDDILVDFEKKDYQESFIKNEKFVENIKEIKENKNYEFINDNTLDSKKVLANKDLNNNKNENILETENENKLVANTSSSNFKLKFENYLLIFSISLLGVVLFLKYFKF